MAPDLIADQLAFEQIEAHMLSGSTVTLLWRTVNWEATKLMFAQTRRFIVDDDLNVLWTASPEIASTRQWPCYSRSPA